jgi:hypothetical protein
MKTCPFCSQTDTHKQDCFRNPQQPKVAPAYTAAIDACIPVRVSEKSCDCPGSNHAPACNNLHRQDVEPRQETSKLYGGDYSLKQFADRAKRGIDEYVADYDGMNTDMAKRHSFAKWMNSFLRYVLW